MAIISKESLYEYFAAGKYPKDTNYRDLIDSCYNDESGANIYVTVSNTTTYNTNGSKEYGSLLSDVMTSDQVTKATNAPAGTIVIVTNFKSTPFYLTVPVGGGYGKTSPESQDITYVIAPVGSIMLVKTGATYEAETPTFSVVGVAIQGEV